MAPGVAGLNGETVGHALAEVGRQTIVVGNCSAVVLLHRAKDRRRRGVGEGRKAGSVGIQSFVIDWNVNAVVPHVIDAQRSLGSDGLLNAEAPLLGLRRVEGSRLVVVGRGTGARPVLRLKARNRGALAEARHDRLSGSRTS